MEIESLKTEMAASETEDEEDAKTSPEKREEINKYLNQLTSQASQMTEFYNALKAELLKENPFAEEIMQTVWDKKKAQEK